MHFQPEGCFELLERCKEKSIGTAVDTAGNVKWTSFARILPVNYELTEIIVILSFYCSTSFCRKKEHILCFLQELRKSDPPS